MRWNVAILMAVVSGCALANPDIDACLKAWGKHPFGQNPQFKTIRANVKVMGIGGNLKDETVTTKPELVLVKHSVGVMSKQTIELLNPQGWYCLKGAVTVLGKSEIRAHCKAHLASSDDGATVLGSNETDGGGVTVMGTIKIEKVGCQ